MAFHVFNYLFGLGGYFGVRVNVSFLEVLVLSENHILVGWRMVDEAIVVVNATCHSMLGSFDLDLFIPVVSHVMALFSSPRTFPNSWRGN